MQYVTQREPSNRYNGYIPITILTHDCGHKLTYFGTPEIAENMIRENGGSIAGNLSKCRECTAQHHAAVQKIIADARKEAGL